MKSYDACIAHGLFEKTYWGENPATFLMKEPIIKNKVPVYVVLDKKLREMRRKKREEAKEG